MPYAIVDSVTCNDCGKVFSGKNPKLSLYKHSSAAKPCADRKDSKKHQLEKRTELEQFKSTLTFEEMKEYKRLKAQNESSDKIIKEMKQNHRELIQTIEGTKRDLAKNAKEKETLRLTVINLSPQIIVFQSKLNPIQILDSIDWSDSRFLDVRSMQYPYPDHGLAEQSNRKTYIEKVKRLQYIIPISVKDETGNVFYRDEEVLKIDKDGQVTDHLLKAFRHHDPEADKTYEQLQIKGNAYHDFCENLRRQISDVHLVVE